MKIPALPVKTTRYRIAALVSLLMLQTSPFPGAKENDIQQEVQYRKNREVWMRSPESPLALAGLFWLKPGVNRFGAHPQNEIVLPGGPATVGHLRVDGRHVRIIIENPTIAAYVDRQRVTERELKTDADGKTPDLLEVGDLQMKLIQRGEQLGLRLINLKNPPLLGFSGLSFYEIDLTYRLEGQFIPYRPAKKIKVASVTGQVEEMLCPGVVRFLLNGKAYSLEPVFETPQANELFLMFKDSTNGSETYEGGRYLYAELPRGDRVRLNFNQAHNPYCAYNSFSTCQIPPMQNWLRVPIRAGEKKYSQSH
jgi:uncharacterized protein (DUF1684 family)